MNSPMLKKSLAVLLIIVALTGILLAILGVVMVWRLENSLSQRAAQALKITEDTLINTSAGLEIVANSLENTAISLEILQESAVDGAETISNTVQLLDEFAIVLSEDIPETIATVQTSLTAAEDGAKVIDDVLRIVSRIPFITNVNYNPNQTLDQSIAQVSANLDGIPQSLISASSQLQTTGQNISGFQEDIDQLSLQISEIQTNLETSQAVLEGYETTLGQVAQLVENLQSDLPRWLNQAAWVATLVLIWFGFAQLGPMLQGWQIYQSNRVQAQPRDETADQKESAEEAKTASPPPT